MANNKKYYWLKLKEDFFDDKIVKYLKKLPDGNALIVIYLKMQLKSLKNNLRFYFDEIEDNFVAEIALEIDEDISKVKTTIDLLIENGLAYYENPFTLKINRITSKRNRSTEEYRRWRKQVFERDNYTCQMCKLRGVQLEAHHIKPWHSYSELRYELSNGITLCKPCHISVHKRGDK